MSVFLARSSAAALLLAFSTQNAFADVTADEVWADWKAYMTSTGYEITASESRAGSTLTVSGFKAVMAFPEEDGTFTFSMPELKLTENGDGTVNVLMPKEFPMTFRAAGDGADENISGELLLTHDGAPMVVSGDASRMTYDYASSQMALSLGQITAEGDKLPEDVISFSMSMADVASKTVMTIGGTRRYEQNMTAASLSYDMAFDDPESEDKGAFKGSLQNLSFTGDSTIPDQMDTADFNAMIAAGFGVDGSFAYTGGSGSGSASGDGEDFSFETTSQGGSLAVKMTADGLRYSVLQKQPNISFTATDLPFPVSLSMAETGFNLEIPLAKSDEEQDFAMGVTLRDFAVPDMLWGMADPTGVLPRDPASIVIDLAGKGKILADMFNPEDLEAVEMGEIMPGELNALTIRELLVSAAGARLTGTGDFTFNNEDLASFDGLPAPAGIAKLTLTGANGLIDNLIKMGLLTDQDAMGARMMMGMFGVPGEGADTLNSEIEFTEEGQILANGQRIK
jgi:hypothetical protein